MYWDGHKGLYIGRRGLYKGWDTVGLYIGTDTGGSPVAVQDNATSGHYGTTYS